MKSSRLIPSLLLAFAIAFSLTLASCGGGGSSSYPGTKDGAEKMLNEFLKEGANLPALCAPLKPTKEDAQAYFKDEFVDQAWEQYSVMFGEREFVFGPKPSQTQLLLYTATTDQINAGDAEALAPFPGGYKSLGGKFKDGILVCRFKFVESGKTIGMAFDGLAYVNNHWVMFPKPWRIFR